MNTETFRKSPGRWKSNVLRIHRVFIDCVSLVGMAFFVQLIDVQSYADGDDQNPFRFPSEGTGVAVVELFTSEGCNSCPSADSVLREIAEAQNDDDGRVYPLAFHVDYWDKLGWKDRFSSPEFTARQRRYAQVLETGRNYTPQLIVNGRIEFVGSNRKTAVKAIATALRRPATVDLNLSAKWNGKKTIDVTYSASSTNDCQFNVALVETSAKTDVKRGENAGVTLLHANVVRLFRTVDLSKGESGTVQMPLPKDLQSTKLKVIGYVQENETMTVVGAKLAAIEH